MSLGDVVMIATDGIYEVVSTNGIEFCMDALEDLLAAHNEMDLDEFAALVLQKVPGYGKQVDDQTLFLVRSSS